MSPQVFQPLFTIFFPLKGGDWRYQRWLYSQGAEPCHPGTVSIVAFLAPLPFPAAFTGVPSWSGTGGKVVSMHNIHLPICAHIHKPGRCSAAYLVCLSRWAMRWYTLTYSVPVLKVTNPSTQDWDRAMHHPYNFHVWLCLLQCMLRCLGAVLWCHKPKELF